MTASIKVHHLNCGTMCPVCRRLINGGGGMLERAEMVCHCLLLETPQSLVLVDTGLGTRDVADPGRRLGRGFKAMMNPRLSMEETALRQVRALGHDPADVRHILPTHLDLDHAGGLSDFPDAQVHVYRPEIETALYAGPLDSLRYRSAQLNHDPDWSVHDGAQDQWFGFDAIRPIPELGDALLMIPLVGHTHGHVGIAVRTENGWLLHCGDAYFHHSQVTDSPSMPAGLRLFEKAVQTEARPRRQNLARLQKLARDHGDKVELFCAHDPTEMARHAELSGRREPTGPPPHVSPA